MAKQLTCIIVDDEPIARKGMEKLIAGAPALQVLNTFNSAEAASLYLAGHDVDLVFLDIQMPGISGIEFARHISSKTLIIFTTAFSEYALDSYEVEAIDYLVKPIRPDRFHKAVEKALSYHNLLQTETKDDVEKSSNDSFFVKSDRRFRKVCFADILFIEGLKDYVIIHTEEEKIITHMNLKAIQELLPTEQFLRINRSYIVNKEQIDSFDNNDVFIRNHEIAIGNVYREDFFRDFVSNRT